jgi:hypothetical protein
MKTAKSATQRQLRPPLLGEVLEALKADIAAAGEKLGFDGSREDWIDRAIKEAKSYPLVIGGDKDAESLSKLMPCHIRARIQALQQIEFLTTDLIPHLEDEDIPREFDQAATVLRAAIALQPAPIPVADYVKQLDKEGRDNAL